MGDAGKNLDVVGSIVALFQTRFDPRLIATPCGAVGARDSARRRDRDASRKGRLARRGPHPAPFRQSGAGDDPHQCLADRPGRPAAPDHHLQVRGAQRRGAAGAAPALRDLRLFAAHRGHPSALRQGGARRPALVGPAAGLPHRDPRPRQGAAGQERRHRAGRRQGRLRSEAPAVARRSRCLDGRGHRELPHLRALAARADRQHRGRPHRPARRHRAARRRRSLSRGRRRQGHRDLLGHRQRAVRRKASLAGRRLRLGRQPGLRPQEDGHHGARRLGGGEAPFPRDRTSTSRRRPSPWRASATCRATCSATACCCRRRPARRRLRPSRHLPRSGSRCRQRSSPSARACSPCRDRAGRITTGADLRGRRRLLAHAQGDPALARGPCAARHRQGRGDALRGDHARSSRRASTCSGSAASAPISAPRRESDDEVGDRANDRDPHHRRRGARQGRSARAPISASRSAAASRRRYAGVRLNTDAIDNSAGVNTSDVEVNIKIALARAATDGRLVPEDAQRASWPR